MTLQLSQLTGGYATTPVIQDLNFSILRGEWLSIVGANGSGKSTLLKLINRILPTHQGAIYLDGKAVHLMARQDIARHMSFLPQQQSIPPGITVQQLVSLGRSPYQSWWQWDLSTSDYQAIEHALLHTKLLSFRDRRVEELSGGERQRAFLALAIAQSPTVLLLDEPTTYLDMRYQLELLELLKDLQRDQMMTIVTVLHDLNLAIRYSDRLAMLKTGQLLCIGSVSEVLTPDNIQTVFDIESEIFDSPWGRQIIPIAASAPHSTVSDNESLPLKESSTPPQEINFS